MDRQTNRNKILKIFVGPQGDRNKLLKIITEKKTQCAKNRNKKKLYSIGASFVYL